MAVLANAMLGGCTEELSQTAALVDPIALCSSNSTLRYEQIRSGEVASLCDTQHLVAPLTPVGAGENAAGELTFPLHILVSEEREYCARDDDGEPHHVTARASDGSIAFDLLADGPCTIAKLKPGAYQVTIAHAAPLERDSEPDIFHTQLLRRPTEIPQFVFSSNECRGCNFGSVGQLPPTMDDQQGLRGDYRGAVLQASCDGVAECVLEGDFTGSTIALSIGPGTNRLILGQKFRGARVQLSYTGAHPCTQTIYTVRGSDYAMADLRISGATSANCEAPAKSTVCDGYRGYQGPIVANQLGYDQLLGGAVTWAGCPANLQLEGSRWVGSSFTSSGLAQYTFVAPGPFDFSRAQFASFDFPASAVAPDVLFDGATLDRVTFPAGADLTRASFRNATIKQLSVTGATLDGVRFDGASITGIRLPSARRGGTITWPSRVDGQLDATNGDWRGLVLKDTIVINADFSGSNLSGAQLDNSTLAYGVFSGTKLTNASFSAAQLESSKFECAYGIGTNFTNVSARHVTLDDAHFYSPVLLGKTSFEDSTARSAYFCSDAGRVMTADIAFPGTSLKGAFLPLTDASVWESQEDDVVPCGPFKASAANASTATTVCPDGTSGPCTGQQWARPTAPPLSCSPSDPNCARQGAPVGATCGSPCDCRSRHCGPLGKCQ